ncbi:MAG: hypothetical protein GYA87_03545, partial [Christensenellaceae bacterium]|nr:hypothetical protein [Christensenellaceae bacterium]
KSYAEKYPDIIKPILQKKNQYSKGVPINETFNFPRAKGKYIALCEGDDYWISKDKLQKQVDYMESNPDCSFCFTNGIIKDLSGQKADRNFIPYYENEAKYYNAEDKSYDVGEIIKLSFIPTATFLFPTSTLKAMPSTFHDKMCPYGDLRFKLFFTAAGYARYIHIFSSVYRENVPNSALALWSKEDKAVMFDRYSRAVEMLEDLDDYTKAKYRKEIYEGMGIFLHSMLFCANSLDVLKDNDLKAEYNKLSLMDKFKFYTKILMPTKLLNLIKKLIRR